MIVQFAGYSLDSHERRLAGPGGAVELGSRSFDILMALVSKPNAPVSKSELFDAAWPGLAVEENTLQAHVCLLRKRLGQGLIATVHGRGYKYVGPLPTGELANPVKSKPFATVTTHSIGERAGAEILPHDVSRFTDMRPTVVPLDAIARANKASPGRLSQRDRAAVAVMPFTCDSDHANIRDGHGLAHDIVYKLSKLRVLCVVAFDTSANLDMQYKRPRAIGEQLRVDYLCRGAIITEGKQVRVNAELIDCADEKVVWADEFTCQSATDFQLVDPIADQIIINMLSNIEIEERRRAVLKLPADRDAWDHFHLGLWHMHGFDERSNDAAAQNFEMACKRDPTFARSFAGLSFTYWLKAFVLRPQEHQEAGERALQIALRGIAADSRDPSVQCAVGRALWMSGAIDEAIDALRTATQLSPNYAFGHYATGFVKCQSGDPHEAIAALLEAELLSPFDPFRCANLAARGLALVRLGRSQEAASVALKAIRQPNAHVRIRSMAAMCLAAGGQVDEARSLAADVRAENSYYGSSENLESMHFSNTDLHTFRHLAKTAGLS